MSISPTSVTIDQLSEAKWEQINFNDSNVQPSTSTTDLAPDLDVKIEVEEVDLTKDSALPLNSTKRKRGPQRKTRTTSSIQKMKLDETYAPQPSTSTSTKRPTFNDLRINYLNFLASQSASSGTRQIRPRPESTCHTNQQTFEVTGQPRLTSIIHHSDLAGYPDLIDELQDTQFQLQPGHNHHSVNLHWGQVDQYCWRLQRFLRLFCIGNFIVQTEQTNCCDRPPKSLKHLDSIYLWRHSGRSTW